MSDFAPAQHKHGKKTHATASSSPVLQPARDFTPSEMAPVPDAPPTDWQGEIAQAEHYAHSISRLAIHREEVMPRDCSPISQQPPTDYGILQLQQDAPIASEAETGEQRQENRTGLPDALKAGMERLSGYSLSDIRVHYNSPKPAEVDALAYAQGTEIHVGPGQEEHLPHEAWHVVQQKQGRVQPTVQLRGIAINDDHGLEREADVMGQKAYQMKLAQPTIPVQASRTGASSTPVMQGVFTVKSTVVPVGVETPSEEYELSEIQIAGVNMSNVRVPTKMVDSSDKGQQKKQGRHTVAWSARLQEWQTLFSGEGETVLKVLRERATEDRAEDLNAKNPEWDELFKQELLAGGSPPKRSIERWMQDFTYAIKQYVFANQRSSFAVSGGTSKGQGENVGELLMWENDLREGKELKVDKAKVFNRVLKLIDVAAIRATGQVVKLYGDWQRMLTTIVPTLYNKMLKDQVEQKVNEAKEKAKSMKKEEVEDDIKPMEEEGKEKGTPGSDAMDVVEDDIKPMEEEKREVSDPDATEKVVVDTMVRPVDKMKSKFVVSVSAGAAGSAEYGATQVWVKSLEIPDERVKTQYGYDQGRHFVPFSLKRLAWVKHLSNKTVQDALAWLSSQLTDNKSWQDWIVYIQALKDKQCPIEVWTDELNRCIEEYVMHQQSLPTTTFEEMKKDGDNTPRSQNEGNALGRFRDWEENGVKDSDYAQIKAAAKNLLDVPKSTWIRNQIKYDTFKDALESEWVDDLRVVFPKTLGSTIVDPNTSKPTSVEEIIKQVFKDKQRETKWGKELTKLMSEDSSDSKSRKRERE